MMARPHDDKLLIDRWRAVARKARLRLRRFGQSSGLPVHFLRTGRAGDPRTIHLSAGIHGDEPAGSEALIVWAEKNWRQLRAHPFLIFPCLNPWGLRNNSRTDRFGRDLNREFGKARPCSPVRELKQVLRGEEFALSLTLHEDYDAQGLYIYEVQRDRPFWGEELLDMARPLIAIETRECIDGRKANAGLVRRHIDLKRFPLVPEAIYLHLKHARRTFTIETPSEFALQTRVAAQVAMVEECLRRVRARPPSR